VIRDPALPALIFAPYPITKELALVGVALLLDALPVHELPTITSWIGWIGGNTFNADVESGKTGYMRKIKAGTNGGVPRSIDRRHIVMHF
jgi:hypothetical protein